MSRRARSMASTPPVQPWPPSAYVAASGRRPKRLATMAASDGVSTTEEQALTRMSTCAAPGPMKWHLALLSNTMGMRQGLRRPCATLSPGASGGPCRGSPQPVPRRPSALVWSGGASCPFGTIRNQDLPPKGPPHIVCTPLF